MKIKIYPSIIKKNAAVYMPPSKSIAHRLIIAASLAEGVSQIDNIEYSDDILATINAMEKINAKIVRKKDKLIITGVANKIDIKECNVDCNMSGSTIRFCIPLFALSDKNVTFIGKKSLFTRPFDEYEKIFRQQKLMFVKSDEYLHIQGRLKAQHFELKGDVSSQYISGLLFALPLLNDDSIIEIEKTLESKPYVDMTLSILEKYNIHINKINNNTFFIKGNQTYKACNEMVEGDYSQFAFFAALGAINNDIRCLNLSHNSNQGDKEIISILKKMNINIKEIENGYEIKKSKISSIKVDVKDIIDLTMPLCILGLFCQGEMLLTNVTRLIYKESNRLLALQEELNRIHADVIFTDSTICLSGKESYFAHQDFETHDDHRIAMTLAIIATCLDFPVIIKKPEAINKSFPGFYKILKDIGVKIDFIND